MTILYGRNCLLGQWFTGGYVPHCNAPDAAGRGAAAIGGEGDSVGADVAFVEAAILLGDRVNEVDVALQSQNQPAIVGERNEVAELAEVAIGAIECPTARGLAALVFDEARATDGVEDFGHGQNGVVDRAFVGPDMAAIGGDGDEVISRSDDGLAVDGERDATSAGNLAAGCQVIGPEKNIVSVEHQGQGLDGLPGAELANDEHGVVFVVGRIGSFGHGDVLTVG